MVIAHLRVHVRGEHGEGVNEQQQFLLARAQRLLRQVRLSDVMALVEDAADLACGVGHGLVDEVEKAFLGLGVGGAPGRGSGRGGRRTAHLPCRPDQAALKGPSEGLEATIRQIPENSGVEGSIVVGRITDNGSQTYGFDAQTEEYVGMLQAGIIDPAKVVRAALQDAASVAGLLITTEAMVAKAPKNEAAPALPGGGMGGMGGMDF